MNTNDSSIGHNGGPSLAATEKIEDLLDATLDATLKRVRSDDCNGTDIGAAVKVLKEVGVLQALATRRQQEGNRSQQKGIDELPDFDEQGQIINLPTPPSAPLMDINYGDPLAGLATCDEKDRGKLFDFCVSAMGTHNAIHSYISHGLHIAPNGGFKKIIDMTKEFRGLIQFKTFIHTLRICYPNIFAEIKEAGGHFNE